MVQAYVYIEPPVVEPYRHGLLDVVPVVPQPNDHWEWGGVEFESLAAYVSATYPGGLADINGSGGTKALPACLGTTKANGFAVYGGVATGSLGHTPEEWVERARAIVELSGQHAVESAFWTGSAGQSPALNAATTPLVITGQANTTAAAVDIVQAVGLMENWLTSHYAGMGLIHATREVAAYLAATQQLKQNPENPRIWETPLGTKYVFGGGYDGTGPNAAAPPGATVTNRYFYMYVTGQVLALKGELTTPANFAEALNRTNNQVALLAEQPWLIAADAAQAAILVKSPTIA